MNRENDSRLTEADHGEPRDANGLQNHRARYYAPGLAVWTALDPWEGLYTRPMSLNGYSWVEGRVVNGVDPGGEALQIVSGRDLALSMNNGCIEMSFITPMTIPPFPDPCDSERNNLIRLLRVLYERVQGLLEDRCKQWDVFMGRFVDPANLPIDCFRPRVRRTSWQGHVMATQQSQAAVQRQYDRYDNRNCPDHDDVIKNTVGEWVGLSVDSLVPRRENENQPIPPEPALELSAPPCYGIWVFDVCIPIFIIILS